MHPTSKTVETTAYLTPKLQGTEIADMDPFHILGQPESASLREIKKAFHKLSLQCHPDKAGENSTLLFQHLNAAYEMLNAGDYRPGKSHGTNQAPSSRDFDNYSQAEYQEDLNRYHEEAKSAQERLERRKCHDSQRSSTDESETLHGNLNDEEECPVCNETPCKLFEKKKTTAGETPTRFASDRVWSSSDRGTSSTQSSVLSNSSPPHGSTGQQSNADESFWNVPSTHEKLDKLLESMTRMNESIRRTTADIHSTIADMRGTTADNHRFTASTHETFADMRGVSGRASRTRSPTRNRTLRASADMEIVAHNLGNVLRRRLARRSASPRDTERFGARRED
jgi:hypothetical protein